MNTTIAPPVVLGAAGFLGLNLVERLITSGVRPICVRRRRTNVLALRKLDVPMVVAELGDRVSLEAAMTGAKLVYHVAGHYPRYSLDRAASLATGLTELENVLDAAAAAGVERLVYVSSTATVRPIAGRPSHEDDVFDAAPGFGVYHDLKWTMEVRALAERRLDVNVACPGACLGPWDVKLGTSAIIVAMARGMAPPHPEGIVSVVDARDVAEGLVRLAATSDPPRRMILSGRSLPMSGLVSALADRYHVAKAEPLTAEAARRLADEGEARAHAGGPRSPLARELVDLIVHGPSIDARRSREVLGLEYRPLSRTLDDFDAWARRMRLIPEPTGSME
ncbi:NAD-dependent epimerase/dehydratase family protein [Myxococcota bacterium]|nr:NAD-dependent epimerase/dehydratase family protein [Myxococcota bacterium]